MSKIGDLFVRLGLKKGDFDKGIKDAGSRLGDFLKKMKSFGSAISTIMTAAAAAVVKFAKDAVAMTQRWGDQWAVAMAGIQGAYQAFIRQISSGDGWDNLFSNMREAARVARETAASLDEIFERKMSLSYSEAEIDRQIAAQQLIMRDSSKSDAERKAAAQEIIALEEKLGAIKKDIATQEAEAYRNSFKSQTQLNDEQIDFLLKEYNTNRDIINQGRAYLEERGRYEKAISRGERSLIGGQTASDAVMAKEALEDLDAATSQAVKNVAQLIKNYDKSSDELVQNLVAAEVALINVDTEVSRAQTRATATLGSLSKGEGKTGSNDSEAAHAAAVLKRAQDSAKGEVQLLYEKYQDEKALLEKYNLDTEILTEEYFRNLQAIIDKGLDAALSPIDDVEPVELDPVDMSHVDDEINAWLEHFNEQAAMAGQIAMGFSDAIRGGFVDATQTLMDQLFGLQEVNTGAVAQALLTPLADMAIRAGELILATGKGVEAFKNALINPENAPLAMVAGLALITLGAAAKAGLAAIARGGSATTSMSAAGSGAAGSRTSSTQSIETELTIHVEGRLSGSDIVLAGQRTLNQWGR